MAAEQPYDVFLSYRWVEPDQTWVRGELAPALRASGLRIVLDVEDFLPGRDLLLEMTRANTNSRHVICILSPAYFEGNRMVSFESLMARRLDPSGEGRVIPLIFTGVDLPEWIRGLIPVDWTRPEFRAREWNKLLRAVGAPCIDSPPPGNTLPDLTHLADAEADPLRNILWRVAYAFLRLDQLPSGGWAKSLPAWLEALLEGPDDTVIPPETRTKGGTDLTGRAFLTYLRFLRRLNRDKPTPDAPPRKKQIGVFT
jgi:hypothetical protein